MKAGVCIFWPPFRSAGITGMDLCPRVPGIRDRGNRISPRLRHQAVSLASARSHRFHPGRHPRL